MACRASPTPAGSSSSASATSSAPSRCCAASTAAADLEFVVTHPGLFFPDYAPEIDDDTADRLELKSADDALLLVIVTVTDPVAASTANLLGPIVVNRHTRAAAQAVLGASGYNTREALVPSPTLRSSVLVLTRRANQSIMIGADIVVTVLEVRGDQVRIGIDAPRSVSVHREEVFRELEAANRAAASPASGALEGLAALRPPPERRTR